MEEKLQFNSIIQILQLYFDIMKKGKGKGQINTLKKQIKFIFRTIVYLPFSLQVGEFILKHEKLKNNIFGYPMLISKVHRPYLVKNLKTNEKVKSIIESYKFIDAFFPVELNDELYKNGKILLSHFPVKDGSFYKIYLCIYTNFEKEGEINIKLTDSCENIIGTLTFVIIKQKDKKTILIGGVQGASKDLNEEYIKNCTKNMYGLFPKKLLFEALCFLEKATKINFTKAATGNSTHIYTSERYTSRRIIHSDYDSFWKTLNATQLENKLWYFPKSIKRKSLEEIPSKKRSQYQKRYNLLDSIEEDILNKFKGEENENTDNTF